MIAELSLAIGATCFYNWLNESDTRKIKHKLKGFLEDKELDKAKINDIELLEHGFKASIDISGVCGFIDIEKYADYLKQLFRASSINIQNSKGKAIIEIVNNPVNNLNYKFMESSPYELLIGYKDTGESITVNMLKTPHIGVVGTSLSGKSKCIEIALRNLRGADITLVNCFGKDFKCIRANRINGNNEILEYLQRVSENKKNRNRPHYIVIDEYNVLSNTKGIDKVIQDLLSQARHFNVFLIVIMQLGNKEDCKFKNLLNVRIAFKTIESSTLRAFLGCSIGDDTLLPRELWCLSNEICKGYTYTIN